MGRWSSQKLRLKNNKFLTIITAYQPFISTIDPGSGTIAAQQLKKYCSKGINNHPRAQFLKDLKTYILHLQIKGNEVLLVIDANLTSPDSQYNTLLLSCNLYDILKTDMVIQRQRIKIEIDLTSSQEQDL